MIDKLQEEYHLYLWLTCRDSILKGTLIEDVRRERAEGGVHTVLDLQPDWSNAQHDQTLKERLAQACVRCLLAHDYRTKLAMVTNKNKLEKKMVKEKKGVTCHNS